jgi:CubicO group peptidase (beta-lactamase class C family)
VATTATTLTDSIDAIVRGAIERQRLPGVSIAVARDGQTLLARGYGMRNVGESLPADADTIYSIASVSKQFTVAALMQLAERGGLRLDDKVSRYFPWHPYGDTIELRHLLNHTSGMPDYFPVDNFDRIGFVDASPREIAETVLNRPPAFQPGAEYQYCNTGYVLLGAILEQVAEQTLAQYLQTHFFGPLEMTRTAVDDAPVIRSNVAIGYTSFALSPWEIARDYHPSWEFATGGLSSTVNDLLKWNRALRNGRVVSPASYAQMTAAAVLNNGHPVNYGFGLGVSDVSGMREIRHTGGLPGMSTDNTTYPDRDIDIVVFVNLDGCSVYATIVRPVLALLLDDPALRGTKRPDLAASSGLDERPVARQWIRAAVAGDIGALPFTAKFERFLKPHGYAPYEALQAYGAVEGIELVDAARRDPETTFGYRVGCERGPLLASLTVRDDDRIAGLQFTGWDERA